MDATSDQIQHTVDELKAHADHLAIRGVQVGGTPQSIALFTKLLAQLANQAGETAEKNLRIAQLSIRIALVTLGIAIVAVLLTFAQLALAFCEHYK